MTKIFCRILRGSVYDTLRLYTFQRQRRRANQWRVTKKVVFNPRAGAIQKVNMSIIDQQTDQNNELFLSTPCSYYSYLSHSRSYLLFFLFDTCPVMNTKPILQATDALGWMLNQHLWSGCRWIHNRELFWGPILFSIHVLIFGSSLLCVWKCTECTDKFWLVESLGEIQ